MRRGGVRTTKKYVTENGEKKIKFAIQGRKGQLWIPVVEKDEKGVKREMVYDTQKEADEKLLEIVNQIRRRGK